VKNSKANVAMKSGARLAEFRFLCEVINESGGMHRRPDPSDVSDWNRLVRIADELLVSPALYSGLQRLGLGAAVPDQLLYYLEAGYELNRDRNLHLMKQVSEFMPVLASNSIKAVLLKGAAALASRLYRDPGTRMLRDIDVLVSVNELKATAELLYQLGYTFILPGSGVSSPTTMEAGLRCNTHHHHLVALAHPDYTAVIEVHRQIGGRPSSQRRLSGEAILRDAVSTRYDGIDMLIPSIKHRIVHNFNHCQIQNLNSRYFMTKPRHLYEFVLHVDEAGSPSVQDEIQVQMTQSGVGPHFVTYLYRAHYFFGLRLTSRMRQLSLSWWHLQLGTMFIRAPAAGQLFRIIVTAVFLPARLRPAHVLRVNPGMSLTVAYGASVKRVLRRIMLNRNMARHFPRLFTPES